ncbi:MAG: Holliday junction resolvase RuvX [Lachnospiraceae bacterium]|nr:Holliday junction resolvase RuvX [Lachnospiraceae bacterium]
MRVLGLDYGSKTVGVALSDPSCLIAQSKETILRKEENKLRRTLARIEELITEHQVDRIVLGLPCNMDGTCGQRVQKTMEFKQMLERRSGVEVILWDERLTTVAADEILAESGIRREKRKEYVDAVAASIILQEYLDSLKD